MPATNTTDIANIALLQLGQDTVSDVTSDSNERAVTANAMMHFSRRAVLREHPWNCAIRRSVLTKSKLSTTEVVPVFGYTYYHDLPTDCLRALRHSDPLVRFKVENVDPTVIDSSARVIASDASDFNLVYIYDMAPTAAPTEVADMDDLLIEAWGYKLATNIATRLRASDKRREMEALYQEKIAAARYTDSIEGSIGSLTMSDWLVSHVAGSDVPYRAIDV